MKQLTAQKQVNYHGINVIVPDEQGRLAIDKDEMLYWYSDEPVADGDVWVTSHGMFCYICKVDLEGMDWKDSLMEVK
jgi:hypothetical protein